MYSCCSWKRRVWSQAREFDTARGGDSGACDAYEDVTDSDALGGILLSSSALSSGICRGLKLEDVMVFCAEKLRLLGCMSLPYRGLSRSSLSTCIEESKSASVGLEPQTS